MHHAQNTGEAKKRKLGKNTQIEQKYWEVFKNRGN